jgi:hypothetical protein
MTHRPIDERHNLLQITPEDHIFNVFDLVLVQHAAAKQPNDLMSVHILFMHLFADGLGWFWA